MAFTSPSFITRPALRAGGGSSEMISSAGPARSGPSEARSFSGISFFFAFMIPGSDGYRGSFSLFWTVRMAGPAAFHTSWPPSVSFQISVPPSAEANFVTVATCGQPSVSASAWPTKPWSSSDACFPHSTRSGVAASITFARARAVARLPSVSTPAPVTRVASSQPIASACRSASRARAGPSVTTLTVVPWFASLCSSASSIAYSSYGEIAQVMPSVAMVFLSAPTFTRTVESGTCFTQTRSFIGLDPLRDARRPARARPPASPAPASPSPRRPPPA